MTRVIAVSAPVGGGKTALTRGLVASLAPAVAVHFDHYEELTQRPLGEILHWLESGADVDAFEIPALAQHLEALRSGHAVVDPATEEAIEPAETIVFETPFGRRHRASGHYIDLSIWVDTPLDVALARKMQEFMRDLLRVRPDALPKYVQWLHDYLGSYLSGVRALLLMQREAVAPLADVVIDGSQALDVVVARAADAVAQSAGR